MTECEEYLASFLAEARRLLSVGWTPSPEALDHRRQSVSPSSFTACRWSISGSLRGPVLPCTPVIAEMLMLLVHGVGGEYPTLGAWEQAPGRTQADVLALFDRALASLNHRISAAGGEALQPAAT